MFLRVSVLSHGRWASWRLLQSLRNTRIRPFKALKLRSMSKLDVNFYKKPVEGVEYRSIVILGNCFQGDMPLHLAPVLVFWRVRFSRPNKLHCNNPPGRDKKGSQMWKVFLADARIFLFSGDSLFAWGWKRRQLLFSWLISWGLWFAVAPSQVFAIQAASGVSWTMR